MKMANKYMQEAIDEAYEGINHAHGGPFGAVIVSKGKVIGRGHNCVLKNNDPTAHGEVMAIRNACENLATYQLDDCEIYTTAEPCPMCMGAILWSGISKIYCGCNCEDTAKINFRDDAFYEVMANHPKERFESVDREACQKLFADYDKIEGYTIY